MAKLGEADEKRVGDLPSRKPEDWFDVAVGLVIVVGLLIVAAACWVFAADEGLPRLHRSQTLQPFGLAAFALITFCTVVWRGMISARQADEQKRQNDANEDAAYAKLLQEGAKLLAEPNNQPQTLAGIATLEILFGDPQARFAEQAMDLLGEFYQQTHKEAELERTTAKARITLIHGERRGFTTQSTGNFETRNPEYHWPPVCGYHTQIYTGGRIHKFAFDTLQRVPWLYFNSLEIVGVSFERPPLSNDCTFVHCRFKELDYHNLRSNKFVDCEFSGTVIDCDRLYDMAEKLPNNRNWYKKGAPPVSTMEINWTDYLEERS